MTLGVQLIPSVGTKDEKPADDQHEAELDEYPRNRKAIKTREFHHNAHSGDCELRHVKITPRQGANNIRKTEGYGKKGALL